MNNEFYQTVADKFIFNLKKSVLYTDDDVWIKVKNGCVRIGVSDFFQRRVGDILYIELPKVGDEVKRRQEIVQFETIKAVSTTASPLDGIVVEVNTLLNARPELINEDPYGKGWLIVVSPSNPKEDLGRLLTAERYFDIMKSKISEAKKKEA